MTVYSTNGTGNTGSLPTDDENHIHFSNWQWTNLKCIKYLIKHFKAEWFKVKYKGNTLNY